MKLTMEIQGHDSGESDNPRKPGETQTWTAIWGVDNNGRYARAVLYGSTAQALNAQLASMLSADEVLSAKRFVVIAEGEWVSRPTVKNGKETQQRHFWGKEFKVLDGMALEAARLRRDAMTALDKAEKFRNAGQLGHAYEAVAQFVANFAGVPLDLEQFMADVAADDAEFGATAGEPNPEALAAAHFARADNVSETPAVRTAVAAEEPAVEEEAVEQVEQAPDQSPMEFGGDFDAELGAVDVDGDIAEEDAISLDTSAHTEDDVLDDAPAAEPVREELREAPKVEAQSRPPFAGGRPPFASNGPAPVQASKRFERPELTREAPQPAARIAPEAEPVQSERPVPAFMRR